MSNLLKDNKELMGEYDFDKNKDIDLDTLTLGSHLKIWWICSKGHQWAAELHNRKKGAGCPVCANQLIQLGVNDLFTTNPELEKYWDKEKNAEYSIDYMKISKGSTKKTWWICDNGHSYQQEVRNKVRGIGCPICANQLIVTGINDLFTTNPEFKTEWDYEKNNKIGLNPLKISRGKEVKAWWICSKCGYNWQAYVYSRTGGTGCPKCSVKASNENAIKRKIAEIGSLFDNNVELTKEWNYEKNGDLTPKNVTSGSNKKVWWICKKGHEWKATVNSRNYQKIGCPECSKEQYTSFPEQAILYYLKKKFPNISNRYKLNGKTELDIFIPDLNFAIEYDGYRYHKNKREKDKFKTEIAKKNGIYLIHVIECIDECDLKDDFNNIYCVYNMNYLYLNDVILKISNIINSISKLKFKLNVNIERDMYEIQEQYINTEKENSIINKKPELLKEWNYEKNGKIKPEFVNFGTRKKYWWICPKCKNSYDCSPANRYHGFACPFCTGKKVIAGFNDLESKFPEIAKEWDYVKNGDLTPKNVTPNSGKIVWWKCSKCHNSYKSTPHNRVIGTKCTVCTNHTIIKGYNDLFTTNPELKKEWNYERNSELFINPEELSKGSNKKVWWKCSKCGYEWKTAVIYRTSKKGSNCPICAKNNCSQYKVRQVIQYDMNGNQLNEFISLTEAIKQTGILNIGPCCLGKRLSAGGYKWKYKDGNNESK